KTGVYDLLDKDITTVRFESGSAELSESARSDLRSLVQSVRDDSKVEKVIVASWADKLLPSHSDAKLTEQDRNLANKRSENVEKALKDLGAKDVETYSMAEHPNWIQKTFATDEAEIKGAMNGKPAEDAATTK